MGRNLVPRANKDADLGTQDKTGTGICGCYYFTQ